MMLTEKKAEKNKFFLFFGCKFGIMRDGQNASAVLSFLTKAIRPAKSLDVGVSIIISDSHCGQSAVSNGCAPGCASLELYPDAEHGMHGDRNQTHRLAVCRNLLWDAIEQGPAIPSYAIHVAAFSTLYHIFFESERDV